MSLIGFCPSEDELAEMRQDKAWQDEIGLAWVSRYQVPPLPRPHVVRNDLMDQTKRYILNELVDNVPLVLTGTPGAGKSTLAAALAADREIRVALPYAVLWAQVNVQQSDASSNDQLVPVLRKWRQALGLKADLTNDSMRPRLPWITLSGRACYKSTGRGIDFTRCCSSMRGAC